MAALVRHFKLDRDFGGAGLSCGPDGLSLAGVALLSHTPTGFKARSIEDLDALARAAYGQSLDPRRLHRSLKLPADALNRGDIGLAMIAAVHLRLPALTPTAAARLAKADADLAKYEGQPRDWHGRWTTGDDGGPPDAASIYGRPSHPGDGSRSDPWGAAKDREDRAPGPAHEGEVDPEPPGMGDNEPPRSPEAFEPEPPPMGEKPPAGWDVPAHTQNGLYLPPTRNPTFADGTPWPTATPELVQTIFKGLSGKQPFMTVYVPLDRIGPMLIGSTDKLEYQQPRGYDVVKIIGSPQSTSSGGVETRHAIESIVEALRLAQTNKFSEIYFNRSFTTITQGIYVSPIRPDVVGIVRPTLDIGYRIEPREIFSPGQTRAQRQEQMPDIPGMLPVDGYHYKIIKFLLSLLRKRKPR